MLELIAGPVRLHEPFRDGRTRERKLAEIDAVPLTRPRRMKQISTR